MIPPHLADLYKSQFGSSPTFIARAPGRVNLLGEHVDYNDGLVLPVAIDRAVYFCASPRKDQNVHLFAVDLQDRTNFRLDEINDRIDLQGSPLPGWAIYPAGVAWALSTAGLDVKGLDAVFTSDIPIGAGLSSSAAVEVGFAAIWQVVAGWQIDRMQLAQICQRAENEYVGVSCGLMDQFASACGVESHALFFDTRSLDWQPAPLPVGTSLVIADSGVRRKLTSSAYNERRASCEQAVAALQEYLPEIHSLRDVSITEFAAYSVFLPEIPCKRAEHVVREINRVESALSALLREDRQALGALMYAGHRSLRDLYEVSTPELDCLVEIAHRLPGCIGARLTGAGFGGCTINLVESNHAQSFIEAISQEYKQETGKQSQVYLCRASQGASAIQFSSE